MLDKGWIKLHNKILDWEWYDDHTIFVLFIHCLLRANHKAKMWRGIEIKRGTFVTSTYKLSEELKLSRQKVMTALRKLQKTGELSYQSSYRNTIITICNYEVYQHSEKVKPAAEQAANKLPSSYTKESNKERSIKKTKSNKNKKTIPTKKEFIEYAKEKDIPLETAGNCFYYYESQNWTRGKNKIPIQNWKSALAGWWHREKNRKTFPEKNEQQFHQYSRPVYKDGNNQSLADIFKKVTQGDTNENNLE